MKVKQPVFGRPEQRGHHSQFWHLLFSLCIVVPGSQKTQQSVLLHLCAFWSYLGFALDMTLGKKGTL